MTNSHNIWNLYGLKDNPFNSDPLSATWEELPIEKSFFGREQESEKMRRMLFSNKSSRILVYGDVGVGKTSFVNKLKHEATSKHNYFTLLAELSIQYTWTPEDFMFYTVSLVYTSIDRTKVVKERFNSELLKRLSIIFGSERGYSAGGGVDVLGSGASFEKSESYGVPKMHSTTLKLLLQEILDEFKRLDYAGVIIHYNNLELIQDKGELQLKKIMNGIRDFLQVKGAHFIFVSDKKLYELFQSIPRVEDIFQIPIMLKPFEYEEIKQIIKIRMELLKMTGVSPITPYDEDSYRILFNLYLGNLRGILKSLDGAIQETVKSVPIKITSDTLRIVLFKIAKNRYLSHFTKEEGNTIKILKRILEKRETTNKLVSEHFKMLPQNVSAALTTLRDIGAIKLSREEGRARYYVPSQEALWLLLEPSGNWENETVQTVLEG